MSKFKDGQYAHFLGYKYNYPTMGQLRLHPNGYFQFFAIVKNSVGISIQAYADFFITDQGKMVGNEGLGYVVKHATKSQYLTYLRRVKNGTLDWGVGSLGG